MGNAVFKAALFLFYEGNGTNRGAGAIFNLEGQRCKQDFIGKGSQIVQVFDDQDTFGKERLMSRIRPAEYVESQSIAADDLSHIVNLLMPPFLSIFTFFSARYWAPSSARPGQSDKNLS